MVLKGLTLSLLVFFLNYQHGRAQRTNQQRSSNIGDVSCTSLECQNRNSCQLQMVIRSLGQSFHFIEWDMTLHDFIQSKIMKICFEKPKSPLDGMREDRSSMTSKVSEEVSCKLQRKEVMKRISETENNKTRIFEEKYGEELKKMSLTVSKIKKNGKGELKCSDGDMLEQGKEIPGGCMLEYTGKDKNSCQTDYLEVIVKVGNLKTTVKLLWFITPNVVPEDQTIDISKANSSEIKSPDVEDCMEVMLEKMADDNLKRQLKYRIQNIQPKFKCIGLGHISVNRVKGEDKTWKLEFEKEPTQSFDSYVNVSFKENGHGFTYKITFKVNGKPPPILEKKECSLEDLKSSLNGYVDVLPKNKTLYEAALIIMDCYCLKQELVANGIDMTDHQLSCLSMENKFTKIGSIIKCPLMNGRGSGMAQIKSRIEKKLIENKMNRKIDPSSMAVKVVATNNGEFYCSNTKAMTESNKEIKKECKIRLYKKEKVRPSCDVAFLTVEVGIKDIKFTMKFLWLDVIHKMDPQIIEVNKNPYDVIIKPPDTAFCSKEINEIKDVEIKTKIRMIFANRKTKIQCASYGSRMLHGSFLKFHMVENNLAKVTLHLMNQQLPQKVNVSINYPMFMRNDTFQYQFVVKKPMPVTLPYYKCDIRKTIEHVQSSGIGFSQTGLSVKSAFINLIKQSCNKKNFMDNMEKDDDKRKRRDVEKDKSHIKVYDCHGHQKPMYVRHKYNRTNNVRQNKTQNAAADASVAGHQLPFLDEPLIFQNPDEYMKVKVLSNPDNMLKCKGDIQKMTQGSSLNDSCIVIFSRTDKSYKPDKCDISYLELEIYISDSSFKMKMYFLNMISGFQMITKDLSKNEHTVVLNWPRLQTCMKKITNDNDASEMMKEMLIEEPKIMCYSRGGRVLLSSPGYISENEFQKHWTFKFISRSENSQHSVVKANLAMNGLSIWKSYEFKLSRNHSSYLKCNISSIMKKIDSSFIVMKLDLMFKTSFINWIKMACKTQVMKAVSHRSKRQASARQGVCPINNQITTCQVTNDSCQNNNNCERGMLCCEVGCGKKCRKPVYPRIVHCGNPFRNTLEPSELALSDMQMDNVLSQEFKVEVVANPGNQLICADGTEIKEEQQLSPRCKVILKERTMSNECRMASLDVAITLFNLQTKVKLIYIQMKEDFERMTKWLTKNEIQFSVTAPNIYKCLERTENDNFKRQVEDLVLHEEPSFKCNGSGHLEIMKNKLAKQTWDVKLVLPGKIRMKKIVANVTFPLKGLQYVKNYEFYMKNTPPLHLKCNISNIMMQIDSSFIVMKLNSMFMTSFGNWIKMACKKQVMKFASHRSKRQATARQGVCPVNNQITTCQITNDSCQSNNNCERGMLCCEVGCGRKCRKPVYPRIVHCENPYWSTLKPSELALSDMQMDNIVSQEFKIEVLTNPGNQLICADGTEIKEGKQLSPRCKVTLKEVTMSNECRMASLDVAITLFNLQTKVKLIYIQMKEDFERMTKWLTKNEIQFSVTSPNIHECLERIENDNLKRQLEDLMLHEDPSFKCNGSGHLEIMKNKLAKQTWDVKLVVSGKIPMKKIVANVTFPLKGLQYVKNYEFYMKNTPPVMPIDCKLDESLKSLDRDFFFINKMTSLKMQVVRMVVENCRKQINKHHTNNRKGELPIRRPNPVLCHLSPQNLLKLVGNLPNLSKMGGSHEEFEGVGDGHSDMSGDDAYEEDDDLYGEDEDDMYSDTYDDKYDNDNDYHNNSTYGPMDHDSDTDSGFYQNGQMEMRSKLQNLYHQISSMLTVSIVDDDGKKLKCQKSSAEKEKCHLVYAEKTDSCQFDMIKVEIKYKETSVESTFVWFEPKLKNVVANVTNGKASGQFMFPNVEECPNMKKHSVKLMSMLKDIQPMEKKCNGRGIVRIKQEQDATGKLAFPKKLTIDYYTKEDNLFDTHLWISMKVKNKMLVQKVIFKVNGVSPMEYMKENPTVICKKGELAKFLNSSFHFIDESVSLKERIIDLAIYKCLEPYLPHSWKIDIYSGNRDHASNVANRGNKWKVSCCHQRFHSPQMSNGFHDMFYNDQVIYNLREYFFPHFKKLFSSMTITDMKNVNNVRCAKDITELNLECHLSYTINSTCESETILVEIEMGNMHMIMKMLWFNPKYPETEKNRVIKTRPPVAYVTLPDISRCVYEIKNKYVQKDMIKIINNVKPEFQCYKNGYLGITLMDGETLHDGSDGRIMMRKWKVEFYKERNQDMDTHMTASFRAKGEELTKDYVFYVNGKSPYFEDKHDGPCNIQSILSHLNGSFHFIIPGMSVRDRIIEIATHKCMKQWLPKKQPMNNQQECVLHNTARRDFNNHLSDMLFGDYEKDEIDKLEASALGNLSQSFNIYSSPSTGSNLECSETTADLSKEQMFAECQLRFKNVSSEERKCLTDTLHVTIDAGVYGFISTTFLWFEGDYESKSHVINKKDGKFEAIVKLPDLAMCIEKIEDKSVREEFNSIVQNIHPIPKCIGQGKVNISKIEPSMWKVNFSPGSKQHFDSILDMSFMVKGEGVTEEYVFNVTGKNPFDYMDGSLYCHLDKINKKLDEITKGLSEDKNSDDAKESIIAMIKELQLLDVKNKRSLEELMINMDSRFIGMAVQKVKEIISKYQEEIKPPNWERKSCECDFNQVTKMLNHSIIELSPGMSIHEKILKRIGCKCYHQILGRIGVSLPMNNKYCQTLANNGVGMTQRVMCKQTKIGTGKESEKEEKEEKQLQILSSYIDEPKLNLMDIQIVVEKLSDNRRLTCSNRQIIINPKEVLSPECMIRYNRNTNSNTNYEVDYINVTIKWKKFQWKMTSLWVNINIPTSFKNVIQVSPMKQLMFSRQSLSTHLTQLVSILKKNNILKAGDVSRKLSRMIQPNIHCRSHGYARLDISYKQNHWYLMLYAYPPRESSVIITFPKIMHKNFMQINYNSKEKPLPCDEKVVFKLLSQAVTVINNNMSIENVIYRVATRICENHIVRTKHLQNSLDRPENEEKSRQRRQAENAYAKGRVQCTLENVKKRLINNHINELLENESQDRAEVMNYEIFKGFKQKLSISILRTGKNMLQCVNNPTSKINMKCQLKHKRNQAPCSTDIITVSIGMKGISQKIVKDLLFFEVRTEPIRNEIDDKAVSVKVDFPMVYRCIKSIENKKMQQEMFNSFKKINPTFGCPGEGMLMISKSNEMSWKATLGPMKDRSFDTHMNVYLNLNGAKIRKQYIFKVNGKSPVTRAKELIICHVLTLRQQLEKMLKGNHEELKEKVLYIIGDFEVIDRDIKDQLEEIAKSLNNENSIKKAINFVINEANNFIKKHRPDKWNKDICQPNEEDDKKCKKAIEENFHFIKFQNLHTAIAGIICTECGKKFITNDMSTNQKGQQQQGNKQQQQQGQRQGQQQGEQQKSNQQQQPQQQQQQRQQQQPQDQQGQQHQQQQQQQRQQQQRQQRGSRNQRQARNPASSQERQMTSQAKPAIMPPRYYGEIVKGNKAEIKCHPYQIMYSKPSLDMLKIPAPNNVGLKICQDTLLDSMVIDVVSVSSKGLVCSVGKKKIHLKKNVRIPKDCFLRYENTMHECQFVTFQLRFTQTKENGKERTFHLKMVWFNAQKLMYTRFSRQIDLTSPKKTTLQWTVGPEKLLKCVIGIAKKNKIVAEKLMKTMQNLHPSAYCYGQGHVSLSLKKKRLSKSVFVKNWVVQYYPDSDQIFDPNVKISFCNRENCMTSEMNIKVIIPQTISKVCSVFLNRQTMNLHSDFCKNIKLFEFARGCKLVRKNDMDLKHEDDGIYTSMEPGEEYPFNINVKLIGNVEEKGKMVCDMKYTNGKTQRMNIYFKPSKCSIEYHDYARFPWCVFTKKDHIVVCNKNKFKDGSFKEFEFQLVSEKRRCKLQIFDGFGQCKERSRQNCISLKYGTSCKSDIYKLVITSTASRKKPISYERKINITRVYQDLQKKNEIEIDYYAKSKVLQQKRSLALEFTGKFPKDFDRNLNCCISYNKNAEDIFCTSPKWVSTPSMWPKAKFQCVVNSIKKSSVQVNLKTCGGEKSIHKEMLTVDTCFKENLDSVKFRKLNRNLIFYLIFACAKIKFDYPIGKPLSFMVSQPNGIKKDFKNEVMDKIPPPVCGNITMLHRRPCKIVYFQSPNLKKCNFKVLIDETSENIAERKQVKEIMVESEKVNEKKILVKMECIDELSRTCNSRNYFEIKSFSVERSSSKTDPLYGRSPVFKVVTCDRPRNIMVNVYSKYKGKQVLLESISGPLGNLKRLKNNETQHLEVRAAMDLKDGMQLQTRAYPVVLRPIKFYIKLNVDEEKCVTIDKSQQVVNVKLKPLIKAKMKINVVCSIGNCSSMATVDDINRRIVFHTNEPIINATVNGKVKFKGYWYTTPREPLLIKKKLNCEPPLRKCRCGKNCLSAYCAKNADTLKMTEYRDEDTVVYSTDKTHGKQKLLKIKRLKSQTEKFVNNTVIVEATNFKTGLTSVIEDQIIRKFPPRCNISVTYNALNITVDFDADINYMTEKKCIIQGGATSSITENQTQIIFDNTCVRSLAGKKLSCECVDVNDEENKGFTQVNIPMSEETFYIEPQIQLLKEHIDTGAYVLACPLAVNLIDCARSKRQDDRENHCIADSKNSMVKKVKDSIDLKMCFNNNPSSQENEVEAANQIDSETKRLLFSSYCNNSNCDKTLSGQCRELAKGLFALSISVSEEETKERRRRRREIIETDLSCKSNNNGELTDINQVDAFFNIFDSLLYPLSEATPDTIKTFTSNLYTYQRSLCKESTGNFGTNNISNSHIDTSCMLVKSPNDSFWLNNHAEVVLDNKTDNYMYWICTDNDEVVCESFFFSAVTLYAQPNNENILIEPYARGNTIGMTLLSDVYIIDLIIPNDPYNVFCVSTFNPFALNIKLTNPAKITENMKCHQWEDNAWTDTCITTINNDIITCSCYFHGPIAVFEVEPIPTDPPVTESPVTTEGKVITNDGSANPYTEFSYGTVTPSMKEDDKWRVFEFKLNGDYEKYLAMYPDSTAFSTDFCKKVQKLFFQYKFERCQIWPGSIVIKFEVADTMGNLDELEKKIHQKLKENKLFIVDKNGNKLYGKEYSLKVDGEMKEKKKEEKDDKRSYVFVIIGLTIAVFVVLAIVAAYMVKRNKAKREQTQQQHQQVTNQQPVPTYTKEPIENCIIYPDNPPAYEDNVHIEPITKDTLPIPVGIQPPKYSTVSPASAPSEVPPEMLGATAMEPLSSYASPSPQNEARLRPTSGISRKSFNFDDDDQKMPQIDD